VRASVADRGVLLGGLSERDWQRRVVDYATWCGWLSYHTHDSRRSEPGFPDLVLLRRDRCVVAELKSDVGKVTTAQQRWLDAFAVVPGLEVHVWRPADCWPTVQETLR